MTQTFLKGNSLLVAFITSGTHTDWQDTGLEITNVPQGSKIYYNFSHYDDASASMDIRITDGTNTWKTHSGLTGTNSVSSLDGSVTKSTGGTGTVKVQIRAADANPVRLFNDNSGVSWICCTDASHPIVVSNGSENMSVQGKRSIGTLKCYYSPAKSSSTIGVSVWGLGANQDDSGIVENTIDIDTITNYIDINFSSTPVWKEPRGLGVLIIGYDGYHIEITG